MKKLIITLFCVLLFCATASAQRQCETVDDCNALVVRLSQALEKTLDVNKAQKDLIDAQRSEIESRKRKNDIDTEVIARQTELIKLLEKDRRKQISIFWGIFKVRL